MPKTIQINGKRIRELKSGWWPEGRWMIVWDANGEPYIRKVACILPEELNVMFPVYAYTIGAGCGHCCWLHAGEIPEGLDGSGINGWDEMKKDLKL